MSKDYTIIFFNPIAEEVFNLKEKDAIGRKINEINIKWDFNIIEKALKKFSGHKSNINLDLLTFKNHEDNNRILGLNINSILNVEGSLEGFLIWGADITEKISLEAQIAQSQKLESIGELAAGIAHEINTPIQYIGDNLSFFSNSFSDIFEIISEYHNLMIKSKFNESYIKKIKDKEKNIDLPFLINEIPKAVEQSVEGVKRVAKIIKSMRDFSHPGVEDMTEVDINNAIQSTITISKNEWKYVADLVTDFDESIPGVICNPGKINQVVLNIIINATHAIEDVAGANPDEKGKIKISTRLKDKFVEIRISDTGKGIPDEIKNRVFDQFFTTKEVGRGTGQGLSIAHSVITEQHKGFIDFESEVGKGTTFIIKLPLK